jgi:hypothetical protein
VDTLGKRRWSNLQLALEALEDKTALPRALEISVLTSIRWKSLISCRSVAFDGSFGDNDTGLADKVLGVGGLTEMRHLEIPPWSL